MRPNLPDPLELRAQWGHCGSVNTVYRLKVTKVVYRHCPTCGVWAEAILGQLARLGWDSSELLPGGIEDFELGLPHVPKSFVAVVLSAVLRGAAPTDSAKMERDNFPPAIRLPRGGGKEPR